MATVIINQNPTATVLATTVGAPAHAPTVVTLAAGDVVCPANLSDNTIATKALPSALANAPIVLGVSVQATTAGAVAQYAGMGTTVAASGLPLGSGLPSYVVVDASGHVARKAIPTGADYVVGKCDALGNLQVQPTKFDSMEVANAKTFGAKGDGTTNDTAAVAAAVAALTTNGVLYFPPGTYRLASTQTISANVRFEHGASIIVDSGATVTINGHIEAHDCQQIFSGAGSVLLGISAANDVFAAWFGCIATGYTLASNAAAINKAIAAAAGTQATPSGNVQRTVILPPGQIQAERPVAFNTSNVHLRGSGQFATDLQARFFVGPAIVASDLPEFTYFANDFAGGNSISIDGTSGLIPGLHLQQYGSAFQLNGLGSFCLEFKIKITATQTSSLNIMTSSGSGDAPAFYGQNTAFSLTTLAADNGYSNTNLGLDIGLLTTSGLVHAKTAAGALPTDGAWHELRYDWDGSAIRIFVDGVAQTLFSGGTSLAQTGTIIQKSYEGVMLGYIGYATGFAGRAFINAAPKGCRIASMRFGWASRGSGNYTPLAAKFTEDATTKFLVNFDVHDPVGALSFARAYGGTVFGMCDAWIPNEQSSGGQQIGGIIVENMQLESNNGPCVVANAAPNILLKNLIANGQSGFVLGDNCYNSAVENCTLRGLCTGTILGGSYSGGIGYGILLGPASNFVVVRDNNVSGFHVSCYAQAMLTTEGFNYLVDPVYASLILDTTFMGNINGNLFVSDEASPFHNPFGVIMLGVGTVRFSGTLFGLQNFADQQQVVIDGTNRGLSYSGFMSITFDACVFNPSASSTLPPITVRNTLAGDSVTVRTSDWYATPGLFALGAAAHGFVKADPLDSLSLAVAMTDTNYTISINQWLYGEIDFTGTLTAGRNIVVPTIAGYRRFIRNGTGQILTVKTPAGTGIAIAAGKSATIACDGTNVLRNTADV